MEDGEMTKRQTREGVGTGNGGAAGNGGTTKPEVGASVTTSEDDQKTVEAAHGVLAEQQRLLGELTVEFEARKGALLVQIQQAHNGYIATVKSVATKYGANLAAESGEKWNYADGTLTRIG